MEDSCMKMQPHASAAKNEGESVEIRKGEGRDGARAVRGAVNVCARQKVTMASRSRRGEEKRMKVGG
jgi:hypothetical protein